MLLQIATTLAAMLALSSGLHAQTVREARIVSVPGPSGLGLAQQLRSDLSVTPLSVVEDSRCPVDVLCVQAGRLVVRVLIEHAGQASTETLELGGSTAVPDGVIVFAQASERRTVAGDGEAAQAYALRFAFAPDTVS